MLLRQARQQLIPDGTDDAYVSKAADVNVAAAALARNDPAGVGGKKPPILRLFVQDIAPFRVVGQAACGPAA